METFVLICRLADGRVEVVRTYATERRAKEDLELMRERSSDVFEIVVAEHIDS